MSTDFDALQGLIIEGILVQRRKGCRLSLGVEALKARDPEAMIRGTVLQRSLRGRELGTIFDLRFDLRFILGYYIKPAKPSHHN